VLLYDFGPDLLDAVGVLAKNGDELARDAVCLRSRESNMLDSLHHTCGLEKLV